MVDGGSTDRTAQVAISHGARVLILERILFGKKGSAAARNIGAKESRGEILAFVDADTYLPRFWLERINAEFAGNPKLVAVSGTNMPHDAPLYLKIEYVFYDFVRIILGALPYPFKRFINNGYNFAVRKNAFFAVGGFNETQYTNSDAELGRMLKKARMGDLKILRNNAVSGGNLRRLYALGNLRFHLYYLYVLENFIPLLHRSATWHHLTEIFQRYDADYTRMRLKVNLNEA